MYHANYLKYFERARTEWLRSFGFDQETLKRDHQAVFALTRIEVDFVRAARLDDLLEVSVVPAQIRRVYYVLEQEARLKGELIARASVRVACLEYPGFAPRVIPDILQRAIQA